MKKISVIKLYSVIGDVFAACPEGRCGDVEAVFVGRGAGKELRRRYAGAAIIKPCAALKRFGERFKKYMSGKKVSFGRADISKAATRFDGLVWGAIKKIPYGRTITYGDIARAIRRPLAARAVANACGRNPLPIIIPCHRVVGRSNLGGYSGGGVSVKKKLLRIEGAL